MNSFSIHALLHYAVIFIRIFLDDVENEDPNNKLSTLCGSIERTADIFSKYQRHILIVSC